MANDETVKVRLPRGLLSDARAAAGPRGFSEFVRGALQDRIDREAQPQLALEPGSVANTVARERTQGHGRAPRREPCEHRLSPAQFCKHCDA